MMLTASVDSSIILSHSRIDVFGVQIGHSTGAASSIAELAIVLHFFPVGVAAVAVSGIRNYDFTPRLILYRIGISICRIHVLHVSYF